MKATINTILLAIIAIFLGIIAYNQSNKYTSADSISPQWEYGRKEILGVDPTNNDFETFNSWIEEGWEPIMKMDGERRYLMRRPKPTP